MNPANQAIIDWLSQADHYGQNVTQVEKIETHISTVFLTGEFAYKLKKRVNFGFLDFTPLASRKNYCEMEVSLNRRTAPQLYLGVIALYQHPQHYNQISFEPQPGLVVADYLVKMRQFDPQNVLSRYVLKHVLTDHQTNDLAEAIADLHQQAEPIKAGDFLGSPACVIQPMLDNFPSLLALLNSQRPLTSNTQLDLNQLKNRLLQLEHWTRTQHTLLAPMIEQRQQQGHVRACHGDLHLDNITLINAKPVLFDGIEFNDQFRWIDTLSDLAFLLIDLDFRQQPGLAAKILNRYLQLNGDYAGLVLLRFYQTYRALVRAKITGLRYEQLPPESLEAQNSLTTMLAYIDLAEHYAYLHHTQPTLYIMQGVSGSGKSYYADQIHRQTGAIVVSSDRERKRLYGIHSQHRVTEAEKRRLYSTEMTQATYQRLLESCQSALQAGLSVVADATFLQAKSRQNFIALAQSFGLPYLVVCVEPDAKQAAELIKQRHQRNDDPSDANVEIMQRQLTQFEAPTTAENHICLTMQTTLPDLSILQKNISPPIMTE